MVYGICGMLYNISYARFIFFYGGCTNGDYALDIRFLICDSTQLDSIYVCFRFCFSFVSDL